MNIKKLLSGFTALTVCVLIVLQCGMLTVFSAPKKDYVLSKDFSSEQGVWGYYWYNDDYLPLKYDDEGKQWYGEEYSQNAVLINKDMMWHTGVAGYTTLEFEAPESGNVTIGMEAPIELLSPDNSDGVVFSVISDFKMLGDQYLIDKKAPKQEFKAVTVDVYKGQKIHFYLYMNVDNSADSTLIKPYVKYNEFKAVEKTEAEDVSLDEQQDAPKNDIKIAEVPDEDAELTISITSIVLGAVSAIGFAALVLVVVLLIKRRGKNG